MLFIENEHIFVSNVIFELYRHYRHTLISFGNDRCGDDKIMFFFNDIRSILIMYLAGIISVSNQLCTALK